MEKRFLCTACGRCCYGLLPLTIDEALKRADTFPLAMSITPIKPGERGYSSISSIAATTMVTPSKELFLLIMPVSFVPATMPCPELGTNNHCMVHSSKPLRCKTMPFYPYKDENQQSEMLVLREGWECSTGEDAPVVYKDQIIMDREDFDHERQALVGQAPSLRRYAELLLRHSPAHLARVRLAAKSPKPNQVIVNFVSYLRYNKDLDLIDYTRKQFPVLQEWQARTAGSPKFLEYHRYYTECMGELERYRR